MAPKLVISRAPDTTPERIIVVGRKGVGKTHFCSTIPDVFYIPLEGLRGKSPDHEPAHWRDPSATDQPAPITTLAHLDAQIDQFGQVAKSNGFRHLVIDNITAAEKLVHAAAMGRERVDHMSAADFKACWDAATALWVKLQRKLDALRLSTGVHIWMVSHAAKAYEDDLKSGDSWQRWDMAFSGRAQDVAELRVLWAGWADHVLYLDWSTTVKPGQKRKRATARLEARVFICRETAQHNAKSRGLPAVVTATWADLARAMAGARGSAEPRLRKRIDGAMLELGDEDKALIAADLAKARTVHALEAVLSRAEGMVAIAAADAAEDDLDPDDSTEEAAPVSGEERRGAASEERAEERSQPETVRTEPEKPKRQRKPPAEKPEAKADPPLVEAEAPPSSAVEPTPEPEPDPLEADAAPEPALDGATPALTTEKPESIEAARALLRSARGLCAGAALWEAEERAFTAILELTPAAELPTLAREVSALKHLPKDRMDRLRALYNSRRASKGAAA